MKKVKTVKVENSLDFLDDNENDILDEYIDKSHAVSKYISDFTKSNKFKQKDIASKLDMYESQLSKWFSGDHNFTLSSLLKLECACNIGIINPAIWNRSPEHAISVSKVENNTKLETLVLPTSKFRDIRPILKENSNRDKYGDRIGMYLEIMGGMSTKIFTNTSEMESNISKYETVS